VKIIIGRFCFNFFLRRTIMSKKLIYSACFAFALSLGTGVAVGGVEYAEPLGGWTYIYTGDAGAPGADFTALDGTWSHDNGSDQWDETEIGTGGPGGVSVLTEGDVTFLRMQETGDPRDHDMPDPSMRKIFFGHSITEEIGAVGDTLLDDGVTMSFRARLSTTPPLDDLYLPGAGAPSPWPADGDGYFCHDTGKSIFGIHQVSGTAKVSFALSLASDSDFLEGKQGLTMNGINGTSPVGEVDIQDSEGTLNIMEVDDLTVWHEFWITIQADTSGGGTHKVNVYMDGSSTSTEFHVTAGTGNNDYSDSYLALGIGATPQSGAVDVDFFGYKEGIISPARSDPEKAHLMAPTLGTIVLDTWVNLSWAPGESAVSHDVYLGENFDDVSAGAESTFQGNQTATFLVAGFPGFPFPDGLIPGTTYYWRIDEVNDSEPNSPWKGNVWSFMIAPRTAYNPDPADSAELVAPDVKLSWTAGFGSKLHTVYFGENFDDVNNAAGGLPQGATTYDPGTLKLAQTYYWRVDEFDAIETHKGNVWSFTTEGAVGEPNPSNGAVDVKQTQIITWSPSVFAASHQVYFGADKDAVKNADTGSPEYKGTRDLGAESYDPGMLEWDTTYYWRIDEVNDTNPDSPWPGILWSFTTANFLIVDDFESYNDIDPPDPESNRIFEAWLDGYDIPTNGALVGNDLPPYAEQRIVHSGNQSMPLFYDNSVGNSETTHTLTYPRDWTENGIITLSIWFRGGSDNAAERLYVVLNGSAVVSHDNPNAAQIDRWTEWTIDLQAFADQGINLANVNTISLGLGNKNNPVAGGSGTMYFDDIRLYMPAP
jgi:hypothetical protein